MNESPQKTVAAYTLGCKVNQYESEAILEAFERHGFRISKADEHCDVYIINTCTVTAESDRKARQFIRRAIHRNPQAYILVTGCLAQTAQESIAAIEGVDFVCGNATKMQVLEAALQLVASGHKNEKTVCMVSSLEGAAFEPMQITRCDRTRAYVKIEDGCESRCTYCIIPSVRGPIRSRALDDIRREAKRLAT